MRTAACRGRRDPRAACPARRNRSRRSASALQCGNGCHTNACSSCPASAASQLWARPRRTPTHPIQEACMIKAVKFVNVPVTDQQRALEFYTNKLGFRVVTDQPFNDKQRWIELGLGKSGTG